ncbi:MAG: single-stranded DNA-binding protein [Actinobacteria bacterium QS_5_72_10]|nr:MAG: single-stranded DNA-binding protein [Actinobacteria bacterium QS_5_72_10]
MTAPSGLAGRVGRRPSNVTLVGNLTANPELRFTQAGTAVANMRVAVNRRIRNNQSGEWEDRTDGFFNVVVWRSLAENAADSLAKGTRVMVNGRLTERTFENQQGETRYVTEIEADEVCPSLRWATAQVTKSSRTGQSQAGSGPPPPSDGGQPAQPAQPVQPGQSAPPEPDDVPF